MRIRDGDSSDPGSGMEQSRIRDPGYTSRIQIHFTGPKKLGNSRAQPPPTSPRNVYAPIQNIMHGAV